MTRAGISSPWRRDEPAVAASATVAHASHEHLRRHGVEPRRGRDGGEAIQYLLGLVADAQQVRKAEPGRLSLQCRVEARLPAIVLSVEERHRASAERAIGVLSGVLEDL